MTAVSTTEPVPLVVQDSLTGLALGAAAANVIMQLSRLPVAHGVIESKVESGRVDKHPVKRLRTSVTYLVVALLGTEHERTALRREINGAHRQVRSDASSPVAYNAFDRDLQLWVAACLYRGAEDVNVLLHGEDYDDQKAERYYQHASRLATTLQVTEDMWPADRAAFEDYWNASMSQVKMDATSRAFLMNLAELGFMPAPIKLALGRFNRFLTIGFLPQPFRDELGVSWTARDQAKFERLTGRMARANRAMPRVLRQFPFNYYLWDARRRMRTGKPVI